MNKGILIYFPLSLACIIHKISRKGAKNKKHIFTYQRNASVVFKIVPFGNCTLIKYFAALVRQEACIKLIITR